MFRPEAVLVWSREDIFVDKCRDSRTFCGWAEKRQWPVRSSLGCVLASLRYRDG